jgi:hexosaminidase
LAEKGVQTIIWSEKLLNSIAPSGVPVGGAEKPFQYNGETLFTIQATYPAADRIPKDILCMHWYWTIVQDWDNEFLRRGFPMFFGNLDTPAMPRAAERIAAGALGGGPSNWSWATMPYLQQNGALLTLAYASLLFWKDGMTDDRYTDMMNWCFQDLFKLRYREVLHRARVELTHTTSHFRPFRYHADGVFINYGEDTLGQYIIEYEDGGSFVVDIVYGLNIVNRERSWTRAYGAARMEMGEEPDELDCECYAYDRLLAAAAYSTLPVWEAGETWFKFIIENPEPGRRIRNVRLKEKPGMEGKLAVKDIVIYNDAG